MEDVIVEARIKNYMTEQPHSIRPSETLKTARKLMDKYSIRHLPVVENKQVVGLLTDRDFALLYLYPELDIGKSTVEDLMIQGVETCGPDALLHEVTEEMVKARHGSIVVVDSESKLLGIFTSVDALKLVSKLYNLK
jgi:acetoin utilization protein AcuB